MNDSDLKQQHDSIIQKLRDVDEQDFQTKTGLVRELIDVSRPLLKKKLISGLNSNDLATYINGKLIEFGIKFPRNEKFYNLFVDSEKRNYGTNVNSTKGRIEHEHIFIGDQHHKKCECGDMFPPQPWGGVM